VIYIAPKSQKRIRARDQALVILIPALSPSEISKHKCTVLGFLSHGESHSLYVDTVRNDRPHHSIRTVQTFIIIIIIIIIIYLTEISSDNE